MASDVDICNLALSHLGDDATVASINPPEGSAQAQHCARFYPIARDSLMAMAQWSFCTRRAILAQVEQPWTEWQYAYALPNGDIDVIAVLPPDAQDDYSTGFSPNDSSMQGFIPTSGFGVYNPQPFTVEVDANGAQVLYTNVKNAVLRYSGKTTDTSQFGPLFVLALSWHLASMLAGPILKGDAGAAATQRCSQMFLVAERVAETNDAAQHNVKVQQVVPWMGGR